MRKTRDKLTAPFAIALVMHAVAAVCADHMLVARGVKGGAMPAFQEGDSSVEFTLLSPAELREEPLPEKAAPQPSVVVPEPVEVKTPESVPVIAAPDEPVQENTQIAYSGTTGVGTTEGGTNDVAGSGDSDFGESGSADTLAKGVQGGVYPAAGIRPVYPLGSRMRGEEGTVTLRAVVDSSGSARTVTVVKSSGYSGLDKAAAKAVRKARFVPASRDGMPQDAETVLNVRFQLVE